MRRSMMRSIEACIKAHGGRFSTFHKCTLSAITHKLNVSGYISIWTFFLALECGTLCQIVSPHLLHPVILHVNVLSTHGGKTF
jgi:hypothetical protein